MADKPRFQRVLKIFSRGKNYGRDVVNANQIESEWGSIKDMAGAVLKPKKRDAREETFSNAMARMNLSEADLASSYKFHVVRVYIFATGLMVGLATILFFLFSGSWTASVGSLGFCAAMGALAFQASFRAFQIKRRELVDVSFWLNHPNDWIPKSPTLPVRRRSKSNLPAKRPDSTSRPRK